MTAAWITGGGTGLGRALAHALARSGARVALSGRRAEVLEQTASAIASSTGNSNLLTVPCDVADRSAVDAAASAIEARWGAVTHLFNNAGINTYHGIDASPDEFQNVIAVNCFGALHTIQRVLPELKRRRSGVIVNISSILGLMASAGSAPYTISKFAVAGLTEVLHQDLAGSGVRVMGVYPGYIRTPMTEPFVKPGSLKWRAGKSPEALAAAILRGLRRGRRDVYFPWYVSWALRLHRWFPTWADALSARVRAGGEAHSK